MEYSKFKEILDKHLIIDDKTTFVKSLVHTKDAAMRLMSGFKITSLESRITSKYLTSIQIKLGDALEDVFKEYLKEKGVNFLPRNFVTDKDCDQIFTYNGITFLIEQKIRDDHDSSKKEGQITNYNIKKQTIAKKVNNYATCCWFIDPDFEKNKKYYSSVLNENELYYGKEIEYFLSEIVFHDNRCNGFFDELITYLEKYSNEFSILDLTNLTINYKDFTVSELYRLLQSKTYINKVSQIFFNNNIPFAEIYNYITSKQAVNCTEDFKKLLKEYME